MAFPSILYLPLPSVLEKLKPFAFVYNDCCGISMFKGTFCLLIEASRQIDVKIRMDWARCSSSSFDPIEQLLELCILVNCDCDVMSMGKSCFFSRNCFIAV